MVIKPSEKEYFKTTHAQSIGDIPNGEHFAILKLISTYIPGDERSRTNPGHGYPEHTVKSWDYVVYTNQGSWEMAIRHLTHNKAEFVPIRANRPVVAATTNVSVTLK